MKCQTRRVMRTHQGRAPINQCKRTIISIWVKAAPRRVMGVRGFCSPARSFCLHQSIDCFHPQNQTRRCVRLRGHSKISLSLEYSSQLSPGVMLRDVAGQRQVLVLELLLGS